MQVGLTFNDNKARISNINVFQFENFLGMLPQCKDHSEDHRIITTVVYKLKMRTLDADVRFVIYIVFPFKKKRL